MSHIFQIIFLTFFTTHSFASVWEDQNTWNDDWEKSYQLWAESKTVEGDFFTNKKSLYRGVSVDCADLVYALRVVYSYENKLPFSAHNPLGSDAYPYFTNSLDRFDTVSDPHKRVVSFINFLGSSMGTETLSANDSYPIFISKISPADFFMYKVGASGKFIRHTYFIKNITPNGFFDLLYSTQNKKASGAPLSYQQNQELKNKPNQMNWGFKRFKQPDWMEASSLTSLTEGERDFSFEQYALAKKYKSDKEFFKDVRNQIKEEDEKPDVQMNRVLADVCLQARDRIPLVHDAVAFVKTKGGKCLLDFTEYDTYSTPMRDSRLKDALLQITETLTDFQNNGKISEVSSEKLELAEWIVSEQELQDSEKEKLLQFCALDYGGQFAPMHLQQLYKNTLSGSLSSHPNDSLERRWGFEVGTKTKCKAIY